MRCPTLSELPPPPSSKTGWPWTVGCEPWVDCEPCSESAEFRSNYPAISVVTPSFNQGQFIEETIRSILLQGYPDIEYIIIDGGSTDGTLEIIRKYSPWLSYWESAPDGGQAKAINKGMQKATGEVFQWVNTDDFLLPNALNVIGAKWTPGTSCLAGSVINIEKTGNETKVQNRKLTAEGLILNDINTVYHQPGVFLDLRKAKLFSSYFDSYHYIFDRILMILFLDRFPDVKYIDTPLIKFRLHPLSKSGSGMEKFEIEKNIAYSELSKLNIKFGERKSLNKVVKERAWGQRLIQMRELENVSVRQYIRLIQEVLHNIPVSFDRKTLGSLKIILNNVNRL